MSAGESACSRRVTTGSAEPDAGSTSQVSPAGSTRSIGQRGVSSNGFRIWWWGGLDESHGRMKVDFIFMQFYKVS